MVRNHEIRSIVLPWPAPIDARQRANWTFDLQAPPYINLMSINMPQNINIEYDVTDDEYEWRHVYPVHDSPRPPTHTAPGYANPFPGTSSGFTCTKDMYRDQMACEEERDDLFNAMYEQ